MDTDKPNSIAQTARQVVSLHPSILDAIKLGIINFSSLADYITPEVKLLMKKRKVNRNALQMALIRFAAEVQKEPKVLERRVAYTLGNSVLELRNDLVLITLKHRSLVDIQPLLKDPDKYRFFQLTQGTKSFTITIDEQHKNDVVNHFHQSEILDIIDNQSALVLVSPIDIITTPGVINYVTGLLAHHEINVTQILGCYTDTIIVINRADALKAFQVLEQRIIDLNHLAKKNKK